MNPKKTICPDAPTYHIHHQCGRAACIYEITFPVAAAPRSIFYHNVYRRTSITSNNMVLIELLSLCRTNAPIAQHTHTGRHPVVPVMKCGMNTTACEPTPGPHRGTPCPLLFSVRTISYTNQGRCAKKLLFPMLHNGLNKKNFTHSIHNVYSFHLIFVF